MISIQRLNGVILFIALMAADLAVALEKSLDIKNLLPSAMAQVVDWPVRAYLDSSLSNDYDDSYGDVYDDDDNYKTCGGWPLQDLARFEDPEDWLGERTRFRRIAINESWYRQFRHDKSCLTKGFTQIWSRLVEIQFDAKIYKNLAEFLLNEKSICSDPLQSYRWAHLFGFQLYNECEYKLELSNPTQHLKFSDIKDVTLILVPGGDSLLERWGHVMYRLVICGKPECDLVISFYANADKSMSVFDGFGRTEVRAKAFVYTLADRLQVYKTRGPLQEYSLNWNKVNLDLIKAALLQSYLSILDIWHHTGNNCTTNAFRVLKDAVSGDISLKKVSRPYRMFQELEYLKFIKPKGEIK